MDVGTQKWRGIYFNLERDRDNNCYTAYFVHNNIARNSSAEEIGQAMNIARESKGLSVNYNRVPDTPGLFYWEYALSGSNRKKVMDAAVNAIDAIRDYELGDLITKVA